MAAQGKTFRLVFMGTPPFAATVLRSLAGWPGGTLVGVYTQPDRPAKRGHRILPSAVKEEAVRLGLPLFQPENFKKDTSITELSALEPDFLLVAAYGLILPKRVLDVPRLDSLNVHASLLPRYRGAAPVQRAIMENYGPLAETGVSIMRVVEALDAGPVYAQKRIAIGEHTGDSLLASLAELGSNALLEVLTSFAEGRAEARPQDESLASYAAKLQKADGCISFDRPFAEVHAHIRAVTQKPGASVTLVFANGLSLRVRLSPGRQGNRVVTPNIVPGTLYLENNSLAVATRDFWYTLLQLQPEGKTFMPVKAFLNGYLRENRGGFCGKVAPCYSNG